jgi:hypothetical protein
MTIFEIALSWTLKGYAVIPCYYHDKRPCIGEWKKYQTQLPTAQELRVWFPFRLHNIALITGWNNLVVIDWDNMAAFEAWHYMTGLQTYMVKTNRGMHVYVQVEQPTQNYHGDLLDIKSNGGYVLIPPSVHPSGHVYQVASDTELATVRTLTDIIPVELMPVKTVEPIAAPAILSRSGDIWDNLDHPEMSIEDIKKKNILDFFPHAKRTSIDGRWWSDCCPFHDDQNPSFWIDTQRGICGCRLNCTPKPLDIINLFARLHNLSNRDAIRELSRQ